MLKIRLLLVAVSALVVWLLFLLPKVVVENDQQMTDATAPDPAMEGSGHGIVPEVLQQSIKSLKIQYLAVSENEKSAIFADSLAGLYTKAGQFDSAAWFAGQAASFFNSKKSFVKAGNSYYEAYTFAVSTEKQGQMAEKARYFLGKVLELEPENLEAKTKIAMTYLSSGAPMQGILMLREVLEKDPKNELALFNMGMLSIQSGQYDKAVERLEELISIYPKHLQGQLLLGVAYMNSGKKDKARAQFELVKQMDDDPAVQASADSYLKDLK